ncbi:MAG: M15 family metallopeptidase [Bacteroidaceae bacterium]|nr:M15 family metallopeptidase [Bacteroidaceae bacterium]
MKHPAVLLLTLCLVGLAKGQPADTCFTASLVPDSVFRLMQGRSYPQGCPIARSELRLLRLSYRDEQGRTQQGEMVCNVQIAKDLIDIFRQLWLADYRLGRMRLIDHYEADDERSMADNNTSCFCYRTIAGSRTISKHGRGLAVDVNPLYNPYVKGTHVAPRAGRKWAFRRGERKDIPQKIDHQDLLYRLFRQHGFRWGGDWRYSKDYQHFER